MCSSIDSAVASPRPRRAFSNLAWLGILAWPAWAAQINPPLGTNINLTPADFDASFTYSNTSRVVTTSYFYWYDVSSGAHIRNGDGSDALTDHPGTLTGFSYKLTGWHRGELEAMQQAGIDVLLPVYWGEPSQRIAGAPVTSQPWSFAGIPPLVQARETLLAAGKQPPRIGLFYDTSTLEHNAAGHRIDLTTDYGRQWFYETIRDFFSLVPPRHWAMIDGKPIVYLYAASFAAAHDQTCIDYARQAFARDFGGREPYFVREVSWQVQTEAVYAWGGALGLKNPGVASLGPGYDHSAVPGREPLIVEREGGAFFERNWIRFLRNPSPMVTIETWNEYHEGTDIAVSREYGAHYINLNRKYVDLFKQGYVPPRPRGPFSEAKSVSVTLEATNVSAGLVQFEFADGATQPATMGDRKCRKVAPTVHGGRYIYVRIDDSFKWAGRMLVDADVEYYDSASGQFRIEFDGSDTNAPFQGAYSPSKTVVTLTGTSRWKTARFRLSDARFNGSQNGGADFRLAVTADPFYVGKITLTRLGVPAEAGQTLHGACQDFANPLDPAWVRSGADPAVFRQADGLLQSIPVAGDEAACRFSADWSGAPNCEVLARLRVFRLPSGETAAGGIGLGGGTDPARSVACLLHRDASGTTQLELRGPDPTSRRGTASWAPDRWYWLRLRHTTSSAGGSADLQARLWLADGETAEPTGWAVWRDYYPALPVLAGWPSILTGDAGSAIEFDFFMVRSDAGPEVVVRLPPPKPARARLETQIGPGSGLTVDVRGDPMTNYLLEKTGDFANWNVVPLSTDRTGLARFDEPSFAGLPRQFYRARVSPATGTE